MIYDSMAGKNRFEMAKEVFDDKIGNVYGIESLKHMIRINLSADENKVLMYLRLLGNVGYIQEELQDNGITKWRIIGDEHLKKGDPEGKGYSELSEVDRKLRL